MRFRIYLILAIISILLAGCGGEVEETSIASTDVHVSESNSDENSDIDLDELLGDVPMAEGFDFSETMDLEIPEGFPEEFPIPPNAQLMNDFSDLGGSEFHLLFTLLDTPANDVRAFYEISLESTAWKIVDSIEMELGGISTIEIRFERSEQSGHVLITNQEIGVSLEIRLSREDIPDESEIQVEIPEAYNLLGDRGGTLPADLPVPKSYILTSLPSVLEQDGYEVAFLYSGLPELAMVDLKFALMSAGWFVDDALEVGEPGSYFQPFTAPDGQFNGYALITNQSMLVGLDDLQGTLIAIHVGSP